MEHAILWASAPPTGSLWVAAKPSIDFDRIHALTERVRRWTCELTHASAELDAAKATAREIERDMIDES